MALVSLQKGFYWPSGYDFASTLTSAGGTVDATGEKFAYIGRLHLDGRPAGTKTLSTGTIQFRTGISTFANVGTTLDIGIQGVASGAGPIAQPDGTFSVKKTLTGGAGISSSAWNTITMNSGTVSLSHGDLVAVVFDMTARAGVDSVVISVAVTPLMNQTTTQMGFPTCNAFVSSAWQTTQTIGAARLPNVMLVFDDGTLGWLDYTIPASTTSADTFQDSTNPDERGMLFQVPFDCKIDGLWLVGGITDANSDFTIKVYSDPLGTPSLLTSVAVLAENLGVAASNLLTIEALASEVSLTKNTNYGITVLATGTSNSRLANLTLGFEAHRATIDGGTTLAKITRNNSAGAFTAENPAVTMYQIGVRVSQINDSAGSGGGISRARAASGF